LAPHRRRRRSSDAPPARTRPPLAFGKIQPAHDRRAACPPAFTGRAESFPAGGQAVRSTTPVAARQSRSRPDDCRRSLQELTPSARSPLRPSTAGLAGGVPCCNDTSGRKRAVLRRRPAGVQAAEASGSAVWTRAHQLRPSEVDAYRALGRGARAVIRQLCAASLGLHACRARHAFAGNVPARELCRSAR
jgi:hypothetical protein